ncbi:MAG: autotransporter domain-containing protein [Rhodospirillales bacterium]|nr:autotransporter domain-containing protein [Rhodospirillales bacterium]
MAALAIGSLVLLFALTLGAQHARAQTAVCSDTPGSGERIECTEDATSTSNIDIDAAAIDIDAVDNHGIHVQHEGTGNIDIAVQGRTETDNTVTRSTIDLTGTTPHRMYAVDVRHEGSGSVDVRIESTDINNQLTDGGGVRAEHHGTGDLSLTVDESTKIDSMFTGVIGVKQGPGELEVRVQGDSRVVSAGAYGVYAIHTDSSGPYDSVTIVKDSTVSVTGTGSIAVRSFRENGRGISRVDVRDSTITATGDQRTGIVGTHSGEGDIDVLVENTSVTTNGMIAHPVYAQHHKEGKITVRVRDSMIRAESTELHPTFKGTFSYGIFGRSYGIGDIDIDVQGGSITTKGVNSYGIHARHQDVGDIIIDTRSSHAITTTGANAHGILAEHRGNDPGSATIRVQGSVQASGANASGIKVGQVNAQGMAERVAGLGEDGYRQQTVTIHGPVRGGSGAGAAGVFLAGGGRVSIWSHGTLGAASGIAILATGDTPGADPANDPPLKPRLFVNMHLNGREVAQVLGDNWIINDGGETTIVVNDIKLHDGATGVVLDGNGDPKKAPNGAFDVSVRPDGATVNDRTTDPWTISARSTSIIADRDFWKEDFEESRESPPPPMCPEGQIGTPPNCEIPPPMCPEGQIGTPPNCETPLLPIIIEEYAPRAAVYEALPGFLLRLDAQSFTNERIAWPGSPVWVRLTAGRGSYASERASVGAEFDFDRFAAEAGLVIPLGENARGSISVRNVKGSADIVSPVGGGTIEAEGYGVALDGSWNGDEDWYARGHFSLTSYDVDLAWSALGSLKKGVGARGRVLDIEAGRRMKLKGKTTLTPRAWMTHSAFDVDPFTDSVDARFSLIDASRLAGGLGLVAATERDPDNGILSLRGSMDLAQTLSGARTSVDVSGERLYSGSDRTRLLMGLGATYHRGRFSVGVELFAGGLGSGDTQQAGRATFGMKF